MFILAEMFVIDGSQGEGGGQVLRASLSLAAVTGRPFRLEKIRARRSKPGLRPQHLTAVRAVAALCQADLKGAELDSTTLEFRPGSPPHGGDYFFDVSDAAQGGSAGATTLILQAILWPLLCADGPSHVTLRGGTHVPFSPPYHYLAEVARPAFGRLGATFATELRAWGWYPQGGGVITATIEPVGHLQAATFERVAADTVEGVAAVTNLPAHIPHRMARRAHNLLEEAGFTPAVAPLRERGVGPGAGIVLWLPQAGFSSLGRVGLPADKVAEAAVNDLLAFWRDKKAAVDFHLADQLLLPMALAQGISSFTTNRLTQHTLTNVALLTQWLNVSITVDGRLDAPGRVVVNGIGLGRGLGD
ncbi:MAG: RNA 3'-terminal phosphate cyclase [Chloroflexota bacterium]